MNYGNQVTVVKQFHLLSGPWTVENHWCKGSCDEQYIVQFTIQIATEIW